MNSTKSPFRKNFWRGLAVMHVLSEREWAAIEAALEVAKPSRGRPTVEDRRTIEGIVAAAERRQMARRAARVRPLAPVRPALHPVGQERGLGAPVRRDQRRRRARSRRGLHGRQRHPRPPEGGRRRRRIKGGVGRFPKGTRSSSRRSAAPEAASAPRSASSATGSAGRSPSRSSLVKATS